jgi:hypothetical protein
MQTISFARRVLQLIDPNRRVFSRLNRVRSHNCLRFKSFQDFRCWLNHFYDGKKIYRQIDFSKIAPDATLVILNNFNRYTSLVNLVNWLHQLDDKVAILILDNASSYPPLLEYYQLIQREPDVQVINLNYNSGLEGLAHLTRYLTHFKYLVVSDADLEPYPNTPKNILSQMRYLLDKYPAYEMVGPSLEINDLPSYHSITSAVTRWESQFWPPRAKCLNGECFEGLIDTTFAMYRSAKKIMEIRPALRMSRPYTLKHCDWYLDPDNLSSEYIYYLANCRTDISSWSRFIEQNRNPVQQPESIYHPL